MNWNIQKDFQICISIPLIDPVFKMGTNYFSQVFLKECKYFVKEKKTSQFINDELEISPTWSGEGTSNA